MTKLLLHVCTFLLLLSAAAASKGYFWHITDFHLDPFYGNKDSSCAPGGVPMPFGDHRCDSPFVLIKDTLRFMATVNTKPDFILWTGDDTPHVQESMLSNHLVLEIIKNLTVEIKTAFPHTPLFPALGNHDFLPKNQLPAHPNFFYDAIAEYWNDSFPNAKEKARFKRGGYFSAPLPHTSGSMLLLNTNLYYKNNKVVPASEQDPAGQLAWIQEKTRAAKAAGEKLLIGAHIPLGLFEKHRRWPWMSDARIQQLQQALLEGATSVTKGMMFGHHHSDTFRLLSQNNGSVGGVLLLAPGITPWETTLPALTDTGYNNPGVRLFSYNRTTGDLLDYEQYYVDIRAANSNRRYDWSLLYRASEAYGVSTLSAREMTKVALNMKDFGPLFTQYLRFNGVGVPAAACDDTCRRVHYCSMSQVLPARYDQCYASFTSGASSDSLGKSTMFFLVLVYSPLFFWCYVTQCRTGIKKQSSG